MRYGCCVCHDAQCLRTHRLTLERRCRLAMSLPASALERVIRDVAVPRPDRTEERRWKPELRLAWSRRLFALDNNLLRLRGSARWLLIDSFHAAHSHSASRHSRHPHSRHSRWSAASLWLRRSRLGFVGLRRRRLRGRSWLRWVRQFRRCRDRLAIAHCLFCDLERLLPLPCRSLGFLLSPDEVDLSL